MYFLLSQNKGLIHQVPEFFSLDDHFGIILDMFDENNELIRTEAADSLLTAHSLAQALGRLFEKVVTGLMPQALVEETEAVQIQKEEGKGFGSLLIAGRNQPADDGPEQ